MHRDREGQLPEWFETEGFTPTIDPTGEWIVMVHGIEIPTPERPTGRVVCEVHGLPEVRVAVQLSVETGELVGLEVGDASLYGSDTAPRPISARLLRRLPFGALERAARNVLRWELAVRHHHDAPEVRHTLGDGGRELRESLSAARRPGRRGRDDHAYASLAAEYVKLLGHARPVQELASQQGYSASRISNMLNEARRRHLLTRPAPGRAGGQLTAKAIDLLSQEVPDGK